MTPAVVIVIDRASDAEREEVQRRIKQRARGWWHYFTDAWIVTGGGSPKDWRDELKPALTAPASVLVFRLPDEGRGWAYSGPEMKKRTRWLHETYTGKTPPWE